MVRMIVENSLPIHKDQSENGTPEFTVLNKDRVLRVTPESNLMKVLKDHQIPIASSCRGEGVCCKCLVQVVSGFENLSPRNDLEQFLFEKNQWPNHFRLSCLTTLTSGEVCLQTTYWE